MRTTLVAMLLAPGALCAGCAGSRARAPEAPPPDEAGAPFAAAASILDGFEVDPEPGTWRVGDRVLLGIQFWRAGEETTLYMLTELVGEPDLFGQSFQIKATPLNQPPVTLESPTCPTRIRLYDEHARLIQESDGRVPTMILNCGPFEFATEAVRVSEAVRTGQRPEDQPFNERSLRGFMVFIAFGESSGRNKVLSGLVSRMVDRPPLVQLLFRRSLVIGWPYDDPPAPHPAIRLGDGPELPAFRLPLDAAINDRPAAAAVLTVVPSTPPIGLCGGVVEAEIRHPTRADTRAHVKLLAARRGTGAEVIPYENMPAFEIDGQKFRRVPAPESER